MKKVLLPYEITLLSNFVRAWGLSNFVLLPYEITLLSNDINIIDGARGVLLPYEITLLSNTGYCRYRECYCFTTI